MKPIYYLIPLLFFVITFSALFKQRIIAYFIFTLLSLLFITETISLYFSGGLVDYQFYVNLNIEDILAGLLIFKYQALTATLLFILLIALLFKLSQKVQKRYSSRTFALYSLLCFIPMMFPDGPIEKLHEIVKVTRAQSKPFDTALINIGIPKEEYPHLNEITAVSGKNIVVISMESLEQGFLSNEFSNITPNLSKLAERFTILPNIPMLPGSSWTLASLYTYMTGIPLFMGGYNTTLFNENASTELVTLSSVLHKANYQIKYIIGNPEFSGMDRVLKTFNIPIYSEKSYPRRYIEAPFGLFDKDLFDLARSELEKMLTLDKPFALFLSTISTHAPNGFYDKRMESVITPKPTEMEFAVASLDYQIGQFIELLESKNLLDNTVFFIFPDHLLMGYGGKVLNKLSKNPRQLYIITNTPVDVLSKLDAGMLNYLQLARLILNGAEVSTNAKFLIDFLSPKNSVQFVKQNKRNIAVLNASARDNLVKQ